MTKIAQLSICLLLIAGIASAVDSGLLNLVMPDAKVVGGIDVEQSKNTPFGQYVLSQVQEDNGFKKFVDATGFDPRRDLRELLMASNDTQKHSSGLVLARGFFDKAKILEHVKASGGTVTTYKGVDVISPKEHGQEHGAIAFLDSATALAGDLAMVQAAIDRRSASGGLDPSLLGKINDVSRKNDAWFVSKAPLPPGASHMPAPSGAGQLGVQALQGIEQTSGGIKFGNNVLISVEAITRSDKDASALADVIRFLAGLVQMNQNGDQNLAALLSTLDLKTDANTVKMSLSVPESQLEQMMKPKPRVRKTAAAQ